MMLRAWDFSDTSPGGIFVSILCVLAVTLVCCVLVTVPIDQFKAASRLELKSVHVICVLCYVLLLQVGRLGPWICLVGTAVLECVSEYLIRREKDAREKDDDGSDDEGRE